MKTTMKTTVRLTESAVMLAAAFVLSLIPVVSMPFGGTVTLASMLPILVIAYRHGTAWGLLVGFAGSLLQLLTGLNNLSYATSAGAAVMIILFDYVIAFSVLGLGGIFRKSGQSQTVSLVLGTVLCCALRYGCHVISGVTVWRDISIPATQSLLYSLSYNAAYMIPETIITVAAAMALAVTMDLTSEQPRRAPANKGKPVVLLSALGTIVFAAVGAIWLFRGIQTEDGFDITAVTQGDLIAVAIFVVLAVASAILGAFAGKKAKD